MSELELLRLDSVKTAEKFFELHSDITDKAFRQILNYMVKHQKAKSIIIEDNYIDKDYTNELSNLYSKTFRSRQGYCRRLHFFVDDFDDILSFKTAFSNNNFNYLGFIVLRPLIIGKIGRSILLPANLSNFYYLCLIKRSVHLLGKTIHAYGVPFIEQDSMVITCAQAGLWITGKYMHYTHSHPRQLPFDITNIAHSSLSYSNRAIPSSGLTLDQIMSALNKMQYLPVMYVKSAADDGVSMDGLRWDPIETIYHYIESEIPVLISFSNHLCVIIGHKMVEKLTEINIDVHIEKILQRVDEINSFQNVGYIPSSILSNTIFVDAFILHDDQAGIYRLLPTSDFAREKLSKDFNELLHDKYLTIDDIDAIIIPLPDKIYLLGEDVFAFGMTFFAIRKTDGPDEEIDGVMIEENLPIDFLREKVIRDPEKLYSKKLYTAANPSAKDPIMFRIYFVKSVEFKRSINAIKDIDSHVRYQYISMDMPRFIWVLEISTYDIYSHTGGIIGEILFDSTANKYDVMGAFLSVHLPGIFYQNERIYKEDSYQNFDLSEEEPYVLRRRTNPSKCIIVE